MEKFKLETVSYGFHPAKLKDKQENHHAEDSDNKIISDFLYLKEIFNSEYVTIYEYVTIDNDFKMLRN